MKKLAIAGLALFIITNAALAADARLETLATKVVQLSGIERSLTTLPETLKAQTDILAVAQLADEKPPAGDAVLAAFEPEAAKEQLIQYIIDHCDVDSLTKTITWLESPLGRKLTDAEGTETGLELQAGKLKFLAELRGNPPAKERIVLLRKLALVSGQLEIVSKIFEATVVRMAVAMSDGNPDVEDFARDKAQETWIPMEKQFLQQIIVTDLYVYRNFSDDDLASYVAFLESEAGKRYTTVVGDGYGQILEDLLAETQKDLIEGMKKQAQAQNKDDEACDEAGK